MAKFEGRLQVLTPGLLNLPEVKKRGATRVELSCYNPGGGRRWNIEFINKYDNEVFTMPQYHIQTKDFYWYLEGISDALFYMKGR
jgi:hypothetical protein